MRKYRATFLATVTLILIWHLLSLALQKPLLPTPWASFSAFLSLMLSGTMLPAFLISAARVLASGSLALAFAVPFGLLLGRSEQMNAFFSPFITILYPLPKVVFLPILVILLGLGNVPKVILIAMIIFFQILVVVRDSARSIPMESLLAIRSLTDRKWAMYRHVIIPYCLPEILTSLRVSVGTAIAVLFFAETFASFDGLGHLILEGMERRDYPDMYASIIAMALLGVLLYQLLACLERRFCHWRR